MLELLYRAAFIALHGATYSFQYAAPFMAGVAAAAALYLRADVASPLAAAGLAFAVALVLGTPYVVAVLHTMLRGEAPPFMDAVRWRRRHVDFFMFIAAAFLFGALLIALVADIGRTMHDYASTLEDRPLSAEKYGYGDGAVLVVLFGSRAFAAAFFVVALFLWSYFFRNAIRIPAYMDGYDLSSDEAMTLTRHYGLQITAISLFVNAGLSTAAVYAPWQTAEWWSQAMMTGVAAWGFLHANLALSTAMYQKYTDGYRMRPLRYF